MNKIKSRICNPREEECDRIVVKASAQNVGNKKDRSNGRSTERRLACFGTFYRDPLRALTFLLHDVES